MRSVFSISIFLISILISTIDAAHAQQVQVHQDGSYLIQAPFEGWTFEGQVEAPKGVFITTSDGQDRLGKYQETKFEQTGGDNGHSYSIRAYPSLQSVVFAEESHGLLANKLRFPTFDRYPTGVQQMSYKHDAFAAFVSGLSGDTPFLFVARSGAGFILSPADHFMISNSFLDRQKRLSVGIEDQVSEEPAEFRHQSILTFGAGVNSAYKNWGTALVRASGKRLPANDEDPILNKIGYWTDNRSSYWYNYDLALGYEGTLYSIRDEFSASGIPLGHFQLDSWWYLKGGDPKANPPLPISWKKQNYEHGIYLYEAAPELFPHGLGSFNKAMNLPFVTHARWIDPSSPYVNRYRLSNNVAVDPEYWDMVMKSLKDAGVLVYEQDWMNSKALPRLDRTQDGDEFLDQMSQAASKYGMGLQYCMPLARHFLQGSKYSNLRTIRPSGDGFERSKWNEFLYGSRLASAVGIWPWADVVFSADQANVLIATLSGGPVGVGDRLSKDDKPEDDSNPDYCRNELQCKTLRTQNLHHAIRADGVVVKPDSSLLPMDSSYVGLTGLSPHSPPMIAAAYTESDHGHHLAAYVFAYAQEQNRPAQIKIRPKELGFDGDVYVYDYFSKTGKKVARDGEYDTSASYNGSYFIVAPIMANGTAWMGDLNLFASMGKKRLGVNGSQVTVHFAAGEAMIDLSVYDATTEALRTRQIRRPDGVDLSRPANVSLSGDLL